MIQVAPVSIAATRHAVQTWHYSHTLPAVVGQRWGVWEDDRFVGVVLFGPSVAPYLGRQFGLDDRFGLVELTRIAFREHVAPVSQIVPYAVAGLRRSSPGLRVVVSFADPAQGHHGGIYQAMNWIYLGRSAPSTVYRHRLTGEILHSRRVRSSGVVQSFNGRMERARARPDECDPILVPGKHRYALPLDRPLRRRLERKRQPYPRAVEGSEETRPSSGRERSVRSRSTAPLPDISVEA